MHGPIGAQDEKPAVEVLAPIRAVVRGLAVLDSAEGRRRGKRQRQGRRSSSTRRRCGERHRTWHICWRCAGAQGVLARVKNIVHGSVKWHSIIVPQSDRAARQCPRLQAATWCVLDGTKEGCRAYRPARDPRAQDAHAYCSKRVPRRALHRCRRYASRRLAQSPVEACARSKDVPWLRRPQIFVSGVSEQVPSRS